MKIFELVEHDFIFKIIINAQIMCKKIIREEIYPIILNRYKKA